MTRFLTTGARAIGVMLLAQAAMSPAAASPLFEDRNPNVWLVEPQTQALIPLTAGRWLESYFDNGQPIQPLVDDQQALVNGLPLSLQPMAAGQPAISIAGLGEPRGTVGSGPARRPLLQVWPASGSFTQTVAVEIGIDPAEFGNRARLPLRIVRGDRATRVLQLCGTANTSCQMAQPLQDGTRGVRDFVVANGTVDIEVSLLNAQNQPMATETRRYGLSADDPSRDTDGDGIPDLIEAAIGLDPTRSDFDQDRDGDGWSDFDEWLRCPVAYASDDSCPAVDDENLSPIDTDQDGWSDLDEQWRGTRDDDPEPQLDAVEGEERRLAQRLRFKEYPNARRLYEREYRFRDVPLQSRDGTEEQAFSDATAHLLDGQRVWRLDERLSHDEVLAAGLSANDLVPDVLRETAELRLKERRLPVTRAPAGDGLIVDAWQPVGQHIQTYKRVLPALPDADLPSFLATDPQWNTVKEFRDAYIAWLRAELVVTGSADAALDLASTRTAHALERLLTDEARLHEAPAPIVFNGSIPARRRAWLDGFLDVLDTTAAPQAGLARLIAQLDRALAADGPLSEIGAFIDHQTAPDTVPDGQYADLWLSQRFDDSGPALPPGCTITLERLDLLQQDPQAYAESLALCPEVRTDDALAAQEAADLARRFGLRTVLLFNVDELLQDSGLLDPEADSDGDGVSNRDELARRPLHQASHPALTDSDGDGAADGSDPCPNDPLDACLGSLFAPRMLPVPDVVVREDTPGGVAAVVLVVDRPGSVAALVSYETRVADGDTATPEQDYQSVSGVLRLAPGSTQGVIAIPITFDDEQENLESFTLRLTPLSGVIGAARDVRISIVDVDPAVSSDPPQAVINAPEQVTAGDSITLDGGDSLDPLGRGLRYQWTQLEGLTVVLEDAETEIATVVAPAVTATETLIFRLRVTDADDRSSEASVSIEVAPDGGNRPPELLRWPYQAQVALGETLRIDQPDILAMVFDPDGDDLYARTIDPPEGGDWITEDDHFLFRPYRGIVAVTPAGQRVFEVTRSARNHVLTSVDLPPDSSEIWVYDGNTDAPERRLAEGSNPIAAAGTPWVYLLLGEEQQTLARVNIEDETPTIEDLGIAFDSPRLSSGKVDPQTGALYYCEPGAPGGDAVYARLAVGGTEPALSTQSCVASGSGGGNTLSAATTTQGFCFMADSQRLLCRDDGPGVLREVQRFTGRVISLEGVERFLSSSRLRVIEDDDAGGLRFWSLVGTVAADEPQLSLSNASVLHGSVVRNLGDLYVPVETNVYDNDRTMQLYRWSFLGALEPISEPQLRGDFSSGSGGFTVDDDGLLYWFRLDASPPSDFGAQGTARLLQLDPGEYQASGPVFAPFRELAREDVDVGGFTPRIVHDGTGVVIQLGLSSGFGQCRLAKVFTFGPPHVQVIADTMRCSDSELLHLRPHIPSSLLLFKQVVSGQEALVRYDGVPLIDPAQPGAEGEVEFDLEVSDPDGASVDVPVRITVTEEAGP